MAYYVGLLTIFVSLAGKAAVSHTHTLPWCKDTLDTCKNEIKLNVSHMYDFISLPAMHSSSIFF